MKLGEPVEWALHCTTVLALLPSDGAVPASRLAEFHGVPAAYLAKTLQALSREGIVESVPGRRGGCRRGKRPAASRQVWTGQGRSGLAPGRPGTAISERERRPGTAPP